MSSSRHRHARRWSHGNASLSRRPAGSGGATSTRIRPSPTAGWSRRRSAGSIATLATTSCACPTTSSPATAFRSPIRCRSAQTASPPSSALRSTRRPTATARSGMSSPPACRRISRRPASRRPGWNSPRGRRPPAPSSASPIRNGRASMMPTAAPWPRMPTLSKSTTMAARSKASAATAPTCSTACSTTATG